MNINYQQIGRITGLLLLAQAVMAIPVFTEIGMMSSVISPDFLTLAAGNAQEIRIALVLTFLLSGLTLAVALIVLPAFRPASERLFWLYFALAAVGLATAAVESVVVREMLTMSINYRLPGRAGLYDALAPVARSEWSAAHFFNLASGHLKAWVFFVILYRCRFIPRLLAGFGVIATVLSMASATAALMGIQFSYFTVAPAGVVQLAMTLWLIWRGFAPPRATTGSRDMRRTPQQMGT